MCSGPQAEFNSLSSSMFGPPPNGRARIHHVRAGFVPSALLFWVVHCCSMFICILDQLTPAGTAHLRKLKSIASNMFAPALSLAAYGSILLSMHAFCFAPP
ncbi:hypothetical protein K438DRAFT_1188617 [Mycena galopus ATCC 62051]|nr:hypothetical protein K438DRAFT_1188617 [Mycena galopus ATCC 62051]